MEPIPVPRPSWPNGARLAVSVTFDLDAETGLTGADPAAVSHLTALSDQRFGAGRGLERILDRLRAAGARATFYVPGMVVERHPAAVAAILEDGHELAHHGYAHLPAHRLDHDAQRREIELGVAALERVSGSRPWGYRSPAWELTAPTLELLGEHGFGYDSSLMEDDRPYLLVAGDRTLVELPVHWHLDDVPHFWWSPSRPIAIASTGGVLAAWSEHLRVAGTDGGHVTYTMHPNVTGRAAQCALLEGILAAAAEHDAWVATHGEVAELLHPEAP